MKNGFHLIEILITLTIIAILATISIPIYSHHFVTEHRLEAGIALGKLALQLEQFHLTHQTYQGMKLDNSCYPTNKNYELFILSATKYDYIIAAKPINHQAEQDACGTLTLNSRGEKETNGGKECWK